MTVIPMECPSCGRRGNVPNDRLNTRLHCKKCDAVFHLDMSGKVVMGEPGSELTKKGARAAQGGKGEYDPVGELAEAIIKLPKVVKYGTGVIALGLLIFFGFPMLGIKVALPAKSLDDLGVSAGQYYVAGDANGMSRMATKATAADVTSWVEATRSVLLKDVPTGSSNNAFFASSLAAFDPDKGLAEVTLSIQPKPGADGTAPEASHIAIHFVREGKYWLIDGAETKKANPPIAKDPYVKKATSTPTKDN
jgi:hypothetical protein